MYKISYTYDSPSNAGPFKGRAVVAEKHAKGEGFYGPFGSATIVSCSKVRVTTDDVLRMARAHLGNGAAMESSARLCLQDAIALVEAGDLTAAKERGIKSLAYSVGIFHADYQRAAA